KYNAITAEMSAELIECLDALEADDDVRVIVLTGAGEKAFCAGADMAEAVGTAGDSRRGAAARAAIRLLRVRKPTIAAVNGYAYGGGAVFAIHCDIRICSEAAKFRFVGATYGLVVGASQLHRIVGQAIATDLPFTAPVVDAPGAIPSGGRARDRRAIGVLKVQTQVAERPSYIPDVSNVSPKTRFPSVLPTRRASGSALFASLRSSSIALGVSRSSARAARTPL